MISARVLLEITYPFWPARWSPERRCKLGAPSGALFLCSPPRPRTKTRIHCANVKPAPISSQPVTQAPNNHSIWPAPAGAYCVHRISPPPRADSMRSKRCRLWIHALRQLRRSPERRCNSEPPDRGSFFMRRPAGTRAKPSCFRVTLGRLGKKRGRANAAQTGISIHQVSKCRLGTSKQSTDERRLHNA